MKNVVGHGCASDSRIPPSVETSAIATLTASASPGRRVSRCAAAAGVITSVSTSSTPTTWIASAVASASSRKSPTDSARTGHLRVDARVEQRPVHEGEAAEHQSGDHGERVQLPVADADDAAEQEVRRLRRVALVEREEEHAEAEAEHGADRAVPLAAAQRERAEHAAEEQRAAEHADDGVEAERERGGRTGEAELRDRVHREREPARDDERPDRPADDRDDGAGQE